jgi:hypothetical protein
LPGDVASVIFTSAFILFMAREKRSHALNSAKAYAAAASKIAGPSNAAANALFAGFLRRQAALAMLLA